MAFKLPDLPYDFAALEPHIDARTMEIHHGKHHATYVAKLNAALEKHPVLAQKPIEDLLKSLDTLPAEIRTAVRNHGGGHFNHSLFWKIMAPGAGGSPSGALAAAIDKTFNGLPGFQEQFSSAAANLFGSGWAWLVADAIEKAFRCHDAEPGQPDQPGPRPDPRARRLGARLLPEVPEPPARLHRRVLERGELETGRCQPRGCALAGARCESTGRSRDEGGMSRCVL